MESVNFLSMLAAVSALSAFAILLADKWRILEMLQVRAPKLIAQMAGCKFCLSWWCSVSLTAILYLCYEDTTLFLIPFMSTPITRRLL